MNSRATDSTPMRSRSNSRETKNPQGQPAIREGRYAMWSKRAVKVHRRSYARRRFAVHLLRELNKSCVVISIVLVRRRPWVPISAIKSAFRRFIQEVSMQRWLHSSVKAVEDEQFDDRHPQQRVLRSIFIDAIHVCYWIRRHICRVDWAFPGDEAVSDIILEAFDQNPVFFCV